MDYKIENITDLNTVDMSISCSGSGRYGAVIDILGGETEDTIPIDLDVHKLSYTISNRPGSWWSQIINLRMPWECRGEETTTRILQDISFTASSGKLMAIMGGSGSGKTSLLDVLACRTSTGSVTGDVYLNSTVRTKAAIERCSGYVRQDDRLIGFLTTRETLMFVAQLKLPRTFTAEMIQNRVDLFCLLFLDEPTSGLDSCTAKHIMKTLSRLTLKNRTIILSIHQPRFDIFNIVDHLMILSQGRIVYNGAGKKMVSYFTALGYPCPTHTNPCDFYIDLATVDTTCKTREKTSLSIVKTLHEAYQKNEIEHLFTISEEDEITISADFKTSLSNISDSGQTTRDIMEEIAYAPGRGRERPRLQVQFYILWRRFIRITVDDFVTLFTHIIQALMMSLLLGVIYYDLKYDQKSIRDWFGVVFMTSIMYPYMVILGLIGTCHEERRFLYFELQDRLYSPLAYYFAKIFSDLPFHLLYVLLYCLPVYIMAGLTVDPYTCIMFFIFVSVSVFTSRCLAMMSAAIMPTFQISCFFAQIFFSLFYMGGGFLINIKSMPKEIIWLSKASYLRWGYQALCIIGIHNLEFECYNSTLQCSAKNGGDALDKFSLGADELWKCALGLGVTMIVFLVIMFLGLRFVPQQPPND